MSAYKSLFEKATGDSQGFWLDAANCIDWVLPPSSALDASRNPFYSWFPDGVMNTCFNAVDRHVMAGRGAQDALIYDCLLYTLTLPTKVRV